MQYVGRKNSHKFGWILKISCLWLTFIAIFILYACPAHAANGNIVAFTRRYDPVIAYKGNVIRYWIATELRDVVFVLGEHSYHRGIGLIINNQIAEWNTAQSIT